MLKSKNTADVCLLCNQKDLRFGPQALRCFGQCSTLNIPCNEAYYADPMDTQQWCQPCFDKLGDDIRLENGTETSKADMKKLTNDQGRLEPLDNCDECGNAVHHVCSLFMGGTSSSSDKIVCPICYLVRRLAGTNPESAPFKAVEDLPHGKLSKEIEDGLFETLKGLYEKNGNSSDDAETVHGLNVRVVSDCMRKYSVGSEVRLESRFVFLPTS